MGSEMENNAFSKYTYIPPTVCFTSSTAAAIENSQEATSTDVKLYEKDPKNKFQLDKNVSENGILKPNNENIKGNVLKGSREIHKKILDDSLDNDFEDCQLQNKIKRNLEKIKKKQEESFFCAICKKELTNSNVEERSTHVNQCIDYHSSVAASSEEILTQPSSVFILDCPLCFKTFPSPEIRSIHIKKCGKSRGLSVQSVIQAIHLQEKHVLERRALGLPLHRTNQTKPQKKTVSRKFSVPPKNAMQSDLQLAKALSLSLEKNVSQSQQNASTSNKDILHVVGLQAPDTSQNPGKITMKRKKPLNYVYPLLLRTEEEREKIILEKVNTLIAPMSQSEPVILTETKLNKEDQKASVLWDLSSKAEDKTSYYVQQLLDWIIPSEIEAGSKLCNLSQIAGHRICTQLPIDYTFSSLDKTITDGDLMPENSQIPSLMNSLQSLIGNSWMSDIDIHTASGIVIPAHKLILALRCSVLRNAFDEQASGGKHILNWQDTSFDAALHFLNFLYTGTTEWKEDIFDELVKLATKYEVKDLLYILNNSQETVELFADEDSTMEVCHELKRTNELASEEESNEVSVCFDNVKDNLPSPPKGLVLNNCGIIKSTDDMIELDKHEQSDKLAKEISSKLCNTQEPDNLSTDCSNKLHVPKQTGLDTEVIPDEVESIPGELYIVKNKFNDLSTEKSNFSSACNESPVCKMVIESFNSESESSNDSCKIVKTEIVSSLTPSKIVTNRNEISTIPSSNSPRNWLKTNNISCSCKKNLNKLCTPEKCKCICPEAAQYLVDSNEDVVLLECDDGQEKIKDVSPVSFKERISIQGHYKLNRFSEAFSDSPFHTYDADNDFNSAICLSENTSLQAGQINMRESCGSNLNISKTSLTPDKTILSSPYKQPLAKFDRIQVCDESELFKNVKTCQHSDFTSQMHVGVTDVDDMCQKNNVPSPEIFICDSDNEVDAILGANYFQENNFMEKKSLDCSSSAAVGKQPSFSKSYSLSPIKNDADPSRSSVIKYKRNASPEIIYCDSSSNDNEDLATRIQSLRKASDTVCRELPISQPVPDPIQHEQIRKYSDASSENMLLSSPESPWIFRTDKYPKDLPKSACSSQLNTHTATEYIPKKKQNKVSSLSCQDKNKNSCNQTTPTSTLGSKFKISNSPVTPYPDYNTMKTPEIKEALKKIGVKALPRKKAVAVLSHIYEETHPWNEDSSEKLERNLESEQQSSIKNMNNKKTLSLPKKRKQEAEIYDRAMKKTHKNGISPIKEVSEKVLNKAVKKTKSGSLSQPIKTSIVEMEDFTHFSSQATYPTEENICISPTGSCNSNEDISFSSELSDNSQPESKANTESIKEYIMANEDLYKRILSYTPLNLAEFQQELKDNGINIGVQKLMDYLDEQCITFKCPRKEEYKKKQQVRTQHFRKRMIAKLSQQGS